MFFISLGYENVGTQVINGKLSYWKSGKDNKK